MSSGFEKVLLQDARLNSTSDIRFGVMKGAQSISSAKYPASAQSGNSAVWNIAVPSQSVQLDTHVLVKSTLKVVVSGTVADGEYLVNLGVDSAFAPFPFHQFGTNWSATINSNQVAVNINDVLEPIIRSLPKESLASFEGMTPVIADNTYFYEADAAAHNNNVLSAYRKSGMENYLHGNGSFVIKSITGNTVGAAPGALNKEVTIEIETTEPLLFSPFTFGRMNSCEGGLYGVTSMNFNFAFGNAGRVYRTSRALTGLTCEIVGNPELQFYFLTPHPSQAKNMNARNIHKFYKFERINTAGQEIGAAAVAADKKLTVGTTTITTQTVQLNSIPDKIFLYTKPKGDAAALANVPDRHQPIGKISINFNNVSGLCSNYSKEQLYQCSREAGIQQSWLEWSGLASSGSTAGDQVRTVTAGGILALNFAEHIGIVEDYLAPNSLGNFNLSIDVTLQNYNTAAGVTAASYDLYLVTMTSGVMALDKGSAAIYTALLSAEDVLKASDMEPMSKPTVERFIGGSIFDQIKSALPKVLPVARAVLEQIPHPYAQASSAALKSMGYAKLSDRMK
jgi:hypothetical protein